ncbi:hypothetical protein AAGS61_15915 [Lysinibacillus sp. KU-BSD001]|uniref:hypothetical protein n=1 Tax=Lysinibacillus sp. KU-BSD001 TaxID=3141328 RepID=UPI0036E92210
MEERTSNGKKFAFIVIGSIIIASIFAVIVITIFYNTYDPSKYGRNNGGVDPNNRGVPETEQVDEQSAPLTNSMYESIIISNSR